MWRPYVYAERLTFTTPLYRHLPPSLPPRLLLPDLFKTTDNGCLASMPVLPPRTPTWRAAPFLEATTWRQQSLRGCCPWRRSVWALWRYSRRAIRGRYGWEGRDIIVASALGHFDIPRFPTACFPLPTVSVLYQFTYILDGYLFRSSVGLALALRLSFQYSYTHLMYFCSAKPIPDAQRHPLH